jgi:hypothetical protein
MARAYFITFTTYGTWLHGTQKGKGSVDRENNLYGAAFVEPLSCPPTLNKNEAPGTS